MRAGIGIWDSLGNKECDAPLGVVLISDCDSLCLRQRCGILEDDGLERCRACEADVCWCGRRREEPLGEILNKPVGLGKERRVVRATGVEACRTTVHWALLHGCAHRKPMKRLLWSALNRSRTAAAKYSASYTAEPPRTTRPVLGEPLETGSRCRRTG